MLIAYFQNNRESVRCQGSEGKSIEIPSVLGLGGHLALGQDAIELEAVLFLTEVEALGSRYGAFELLGGAYPAEA